ncbi:AraC family ligand binding domain-containing protein [Paenibacillus macquariensis]|uniref:AraC-like ligand binding domain-containing protein n=1 Tax=Paenibacillus macquariensis TaxID=948756 RepID=A0ABY1JKX6_9BACL|nr:AraC family ligand binding domain-containing protein [Paenibacillus macquariensis]MEC0090026.1 AraC family ligand binding domain-containing protein [Paenibacillus macquariensis]OAB31091.1 hypothetical protein PMSM_20415 [Paenibacillus macquariensis subsp. macquariensis]SIQ36342.1 AraC-like ligand binding domain-containing protein [Paenibacillus macquariensis]
MDIQPPTDFLQHAMIKCSYNSGKVKCEPGWSWNPRLLPQDWDLWYVISGTGSMNVNDEYFSINKGTCFLTRPMDRIHATQNPEDRLTVIYHHFSLTHSLTQQAFRSEELPSRLTRVQDSFGFEQHLNQLLDILDRKDIWIEEEFHSLMKHVLLLLYKAHASQEEWSEAKLRQQKIIQGVTN